MKTNKNRNWIKSGVELLFGLTCALILGAVFYGAMAYQLSEKPGQEVLTPAEIPADALLALPDAQMVSEQTLQQEMGGEICTVTTRIYRRDDLEIDAVSAAPAAYMERLAKEGWTAQPVTGFSLAGLDAVYSVRGEEGLLACRSGERIYMLRAAAGEQAIYTLGASACFE